MMYEKLIDELRQAYDDSAADRQQGSLSAWKIRERQTFLDLLKQEEKTVLLEIGAGPGKDSKFYQDNGLQVASTDLSPQMVQLCRDKGLEAYEMDFKNLDFPSGHFDAVYALNCLLHVPKKDLPEVLAGIQRLLKPSGLFFMAVYGGPDSEGVWEKDYHQPKRFFSFYSDERIKRAVAHTFDIYDFKSIMPPSETDQDLHIQRLILRKA